MKATGIVRRIDDLGRVVIPKEIRRTMRIREGDPLEIYTDKNGEVIFKKYSSVGENFEYALACCNAVNKSAGLAVCVFDSDSLVASAGIPKKDISAAVISDEMERLMNERKVYVRSSEDDRKTYAGRSIAVCAPIVSDGDHVGSVVALKDEIPSESDAVIVKTVSGVIGSGLV